MIHSCGPNPNAMQPAIKMLAAILPRNADVNAPQCMVCNLPRVPRGACTREGVCPIATVHARRPSGRLFVLTIDRCSGEIVSAQPLEARPGPYAYGPQPRRWDRSY